MERTREIINPDLQKFIDKFEPNKFKVMTRGIEIRGINDLHKNINEARALINKLKLNLTVSHNAKMLSYRAFEVNTL